MSDPTVEKIRSWCAEHRRIGGDLILESMSDEEIEELGSLPEALKWIESRLEIALNSRFGLDTDPELIRWQEFQEWIAHCVPSLVDDAELHW